MRRSTSPGATSPTPPADPPIGAPITFDGKTYSLGVFTTHAIEDSDDERDTSPGQKVLTLRAEHLLRAVTPRRPKHAARGSRIRVRATGRHEARPAGPRTRRTASSSRTSSADPGESDPSDEPGRRCQACGADISHRRIDAKTCEGTRCRKAKSRGKVAPAPSPVIRIDRPLEDEIAAKAWQRHLAWAQDVRPGIRDDLTRELEDLYAELRYRRARQPLPAFEGHIASYDYDVRAAQVWRRPRRRRSGLVTTKRLEAVA